MCESELSIDVHVAVTELGQIVALGLHRRCAVLEDQMRDKHRADQRYRRAGVKFVVQALAERMLFQFGKRQARMHDGGVHEMLQCSRL